MINHKELRIGNLIFCSLNEAIRIPDNNPCRVDAILFGEVIIDISPYAPETISCRFQHCIGIQLTAEWLRKFGFDEKYKSSSNRWTKCSQNVNRVLELHDCEDDDGQTHEVFLYEFYLEIKYVHQLQNLYFALTGEDLTIK